MENLSIIEGGSIICSQNLLLLLGLNWARPNHFSQQRNGWVDLGASHSSSAWPQFSALSMLFETAGSGLFFHVWRCRSKLAAVIQWSSMYGQKKTQVDLINYKEDGGLCREEETYTYGSKSFDAATFFHSRIPLETRRGKNIGHSALVISKIQN